MSRASLRPAVLNLEAWAARLLAALDREVAVGTEDRQLEVRRDSEDVFRNAFP